MSKRSKTVGQLLDETYSQVRIRPTEESGDNGLWGSLAQDTLDTAEQLRKRHPEVRAVAFVLWTPGQMVDDKPNTASHSSIGFNFPEDWTHEEMIELHQELALTFIASLRQLRRPDSKMNEDLGQGPLDIIARFLKDTP